jgi:hypothetical protein
LQQYMRHDSVLHAYHSACTAKHLACTACLSILLAHLGYRKGAIKHEVPQALGYGGAERPEGSCIEQQQPLAELGLLGSQANCQISCTMQKHYQADAPKHSPQALSCRCPQALSCSCTKHYLADVPKHYLADVSKQHYLAVVPSTVPKHYLADAPKYVLQRSPSTILEETSKHYPQYGIARCPKKQLSQRRDLSHSRLCHAGCQRMHTHTSQGMQQLTPQWQSDATPQLMKDVTSKAVANNVYWLLDNSLDKALQLVCPNIHREG